MRLVGKIFLYADVSPFLPKKSGIHKRLKLGEPARKVVEVGNKCAPGKKKCAAGNKKKCALGILKKCAAGNRKTVHLSKKKCALGI